MKMRLSRLTRCDFYQWPIDACLSTVQGREEKEDP